MQFTKKAVTILLPLIFTGNTFADGYFGASLGAAGVDYDSTGTESDGYGFGRLFYGLRINDFLSAEAGFLTGSSADEEDKSDSKDDIEIDIFFVKAKAAIDISENNSLYATAGADFYDYEIKDKNNNISKEDGVGYSYAFGWQYSINKYFNTSIDLENSDLGDMKSGSINFAIMYNH